MKADPPEMLRLLSWMNTHSLAMEGASWFRTLPPAALANPGVAVEAAQAYLLLLDWKSLRAFASTGNWKDDEFLRHAFMARALRELGDANGSRDHWETAVELAARQPERLPGLERIAMVWNWQKESEELLWLVAGSSTKPRKALLILEERYERTGNTGQLNRVWARLAELDPSDTGARDKLTMTSLLLGVDRGKAAKDAAELAGKNPSDPDILGTYGLALHLESKPDKGVELMAGLKPGDLNRPRLAAIYGMLLADKGSADAGRYLAIAQAGSLLPEERLLVAEALNPASRSLVQPAALQLSTPPPIADPTPRKYVFHAMPDATPFQYKYVPHPAPSLAPKVAKP